MSFWKKNKSDDLLKGSPSSSKMTQSNTQHSFKVGGRELSSEGELTQQGSRFLFEKNGGASSSRSATTLKPEVLVTPSGEGASAHSIGVQKKPRTALGVGTSIQGKLTFDTPVTIEGSLKGEIFSSAKIQIAPTAVVIAKIQAPELLVQGSLDGEIIATERIEVRGEGKVSGILKTRSFVLEQGCAFNGECFMERF